MPEWISVKEQLPEVLEKVLVHYERGTVEVGYRLRYEGFILENLYGEATHWMPLPKPPKGE